MCSGKTFDCDFLLFPVCNFCWPAVTKSAGWARLTAFNFFSVWNRSSLGLLGNKIWVWFPCNLRLQISLTSFYWACRLNWLWRRPITRSTCLWGTRWSLCQGRWRSCRWPSTRPSPCLQNCQRSNVYDSASEYPPSLSFKLQHLVPHIPSPGWSYPSVTQSVFVLSLCLSILFQSQHKEPPLLSVCAVGSARLFNVYLHIQDLTDSYWPISVTMISR